MDRQHLGMTVFSWLKNTFAAGNICSIGPRSGPIFARSSFSTASAHASQDKQAFNRMPQILQL